MRNRSVSPTSKAKKQNLLKGVSNMLGIAKKNKDKLFGIIDNRPEDGPVAIPQKQFQDDHRYCETYNGKNILITGCTGNIGCNLFDTLITRSTPNKIAIFTRDIERLPEQLKFECDKLSHDPQKKYYAYQVNFDFEDPKEAN